ncbi:MAG: tripartite tricarboxylate transporter substrate binding protein [Hyphomicrobiales bacterium]|nr:tripartite tricarboxylate transporter substrate binding protein [Hyphomicrobiales bacterium]
MRRFLIGASASLAVLAGLLTPAPAADEFPSRTVRIVNGPSPEAIPRLFSDRLNKRWGAPVIVEARSGAGGEIAAKTVSSADPDGYTILFATSSFPLNVALQTAGYDFVKEFAPIALVGTYPFVLIVNKNLPVNSVAELIALAKAKPNEINCGSAGQGTPPHLACEMFNNLAGVKTVHVPFREANAAMQALLGNHVQISFAVSTAARAQISGDAVRALGLTSSERSSLFPGIPTLSEAGLQGFDLRGWGGFVAPAATPAPIIAKLNAGIVQEVQAPDVKAALAKLGVEVRAPHSADEFRTYVADDIARWNRIIDIGGVARGRPK